MRWNEIPASTGAVSMETYVEGSSESRPGKLRAPSERVGTAEQNRNHVYKGLLFCTADPEAALETSSTSRSPENLKGGRKEAAKSRSPRASLVVPWLRTCLPTQETWVRSLAREAPTGRRATRPAGHNY